jgi:hypothetical protein
MTAKLPRPSRRCPPSRSKSAACRPRSRTARRTAITAALARWLAPGDLLHQPQVDRRLAEIFAALADLSRGRPRPSPADQPRAGVEGHPDAAQDQLLLGYIEGWALYSEQLADELGGYKGIERAGYLQSFLFRAARLVVDTGLNSKGWSREQAVDYMVATTGFARPRVQREVERYCTRSARPAATRSATSPGSAPAEGAEGARASSTSSSSTRC